MKSTSRCCIMFLAVLLLSPLQTHASTMTAGDLIKGESWSSVYYLGTDNKRHAFPTESTYFSWYSDFSTVKTVSDVELGSITLGKNVTLKPGTKMIKVTTDPKTYAVDGKSIRAILDEKVAIELYGDTWNKQIVDIPDTFFTNYTLGTEVSSVNDYSLSEQVESYTSIDSVLNPVVSIENGDYEGTNEQQDESTNESKYEVPSEYQEWLNEKNEEKNKEEWEMKEPCKIQTDIYSGEDTFKTAYSTVYYHLSETNDFNITIQHTTGVVLARFYPMNNGIRTNERTDGMEVDVKFSASGEWLEPEGWRYERVLDLNVTGTRSMSLSCKSLDNTTETVSNITLTIE